MFYTAQTGESPGDTLATGRPLPEENVSKVWELFLLRVTCNFILQLDLSGDLSQINV